MFVYVYSLLTGLTPLLQTSWSHWSHVCNGFVKCRYRPGGGHIRTPLSCQEKVALTVEGGGGLLGMSRQLGGIDVY